MHTPGRPLVRLKAVAARAAHFSSRTVIILRPDRIADTVNDTCPPTVIPKNMVHPTSQQGPGQCLSTRHPWHVMPPPAPLHKPIRWRLSQSPIRRQRESTPAAHGPPPLVKESELTYYIFYALTPKRPPSRRHPNGPPREKGPFSPSCNRYDSETNETILRYEKTFFSYDTGLTADRTKSNSR